MHETAQSTWARNVNSWSISARIRDATFSDGDFNPRAYVESVACDVPDIAASWTCVSPRSARSLEQERTVHHCNISDCLHLAS
jgi:hypothetical protein